MVLQSSPLNVCTELKHEGDFCAMHHIPRHVCEEILRSDDPVGQLRKNPVILSFIIVACTNPNHMYPLKRFQVLYRQDLAFSFIYLLFFKDMLARSFLNSASLLYCEQNPS